MYQTLYRKYRPQRFDEVVGQEIVVKTLNNAIINDKVSHAYIFEGQRGTGKTSLAKIFAKTVNCINLIDGLSCEKCESCKKINNNKSMDIIEMDAASSNSVDDIRNLINQVSAVPYDSKYKVYIIDEVHMLTAGAFNALLKTIEEPPKYVIFILATTDIQKVPPTIISRCQVFNFKKISDSNIKKRLKYICDSEKISIDDEALSTISRFSNGGLRDAISILDQVISYKNDNINENDVHLVNGTITQYDLEKCINDLLNLNLENLFLVFDEYENKGKNLIKLSEEIELFLKNIVLTKFAPDYCKRIKIDNDLYSKYNNKYELVLPLITNLDECLIKMKNSSNPKLILELMIIKYFSDNENLNINNSINSKNKNVNNSNYISKDNIDDKDSYININTSKTNNLQSNNITFTKLNDKFKCMRTNNTLCYINKSYMNKCKSLVKELEKYVIGSKYNYFPELILDGKIKAAGNNYIVFCYENSSDEQLFNNNIRSIEQMFTDLFNDSFKLIALTEDDWIPFKNRFNNHEKFELMDENISIEDNNSLKSEDEIEQIFNDLII